jgi:hypothetical protein
VIRKDKTMERFQGCIEEREVVRIDVYQASICGRVLHKSEAAVHSRILTLYLLNLGVD